MCLYNLWWVQNLVCDVLDYHVHMSTPVGEFVIVTHVYHSCPVLFMCFKTCVYLIILDMLDFDVILGMTWSSPCHGVINLYAKTVTL